MVKALIKEERLTGSTEHGDLPLSPNRAGESTTGEEGSGADS